MEVESADVEEQRKIAEGADALLNLAGITTLNSLPATPLKRQNAPFRPRLLRKTPPVKQSQDSCMKNHWKLGGLVSENNNIIENENKLDDYRPPAKIRRKSMSGSGKSLGKFKR